MAGWGLDPKVLLKTGTPLNTPTKLHPHPPNG